MPDDTADRRAPGDGPVGLQTPASWRPIAAFVTTDHADGPRAGARAAGVPTDDRAAVVAAAAAAPRGGETPERGRGRGDAGGGGVAWRLAAPAPGGATYAVAGGGRGVAAVLADRTGRPFARLAPTDDSPTTSDGAPWRAPPASVTAGGGGGHRTPSADPGAGAPDPLVGPVRVDHAVAPGGGTTGRTLAVGRTDYDARAPADRLVNLPAPGGLEYLVVVTPGPDGGPPAVNVLLREGDAGGGPHAPFAVLTPRPHPTDADTGRVPDRVAFEAGVAALVPAPTDLAGPAAGGGDSGGGDSRGGETGGATGGGGGDGRGGSSVTYPRGTPLGEL